MTGIEQTYLWFLVFALITLAGSIAVTSITGYTIAAAQTPDEKAVAWFDFANAILMLVALTLVFVLMVVSFLAIIFPDVLKYLLAHRLDTFLLTAGFFLCIAIKKYSLLPFRYWFLKHFGVLPSSSRKALLRRTTQVTLDDMLLDSAMLTAEERSVLLQRLLLKG